jgi:hypothetical protein
MPIAAKDKIGEPVSSGKWGKLSVMVVMGFSLLAICKLRSIDIYKPHLCLKMLKLVFCN